MSIVADKKVTNISVEGYSDVRLKSFSIIEREGKKPVYFVELADASTFETTGEMILLKQLTTEEAFKIKALETKAVKAVLRVSPYNGRSSIACIDIQPL